LPDGVCRKDRRGFAGRVCGENREVPQVECVETVVEKIVPQVESVSKKIVEVHKGQGEEGSAGTLCREDRGGSPGRA
jgi:hypothetical protein